MSNILEDWWESGGLIPMWQDDSTEEAQKSAEKAADTEAQAYIKAANINKNMQLKILDFIKGQSELPSAIRDQALIRLAGLQGLTLTPTTTETAASAPARPTALSDYVMDSGMRSPRETSVFGGSLGSGAGFGTTGTSNRPSGARFGMPSSILPGLASHIGAVAPKAASQSSLTPGYTAEWSDVDPYAEQNEMIGLAEGSPLYDAIMSGRDMGEEAILRNASATGGLRSGNTNYNLYDYNTRLQNQALLQSYNEQVANKMRDIAQLQGLAGLDTGTNEMAQIMSNIGNIGAQGALGAGQATAQGILSSGQIGQAGAQQNTNTMMNLGQMGLLAYLISDRRLKKNVHKIGEFADLNVYRFTWRSAAEQYGLSGDSVGCMADEVHRKYPNFVTPTPHGHLAILYDNLFGYIKETVNG